MFLFKVMDMYSCRSMGAITKSVKALDHEATVRIDMVEHCVEIDSGLALEDELRQAIGRAGFTPVPAEAGPSSRSHSGTVDVLLPLD